MNKQRLQSFVEWPLLAIFSGFLLFHTLPRAWKTLNTDFPNYYLASSVAHDGVETSRTNEWMWLQRQKDHRNIDQRVAGLVPITPFSTLAIWTWDGLPPLVAKHRWLLVQMTLLVFIAFALRSITGQPLRRIALLTVICFPIHRNLLYGQFYILLLALMVAGCWAYQRRQSTLAGSLIALAAAVKVFPIIFLLYFVRKRDWRALGATLLTGTLAAGISILAFGWNMHRTYLLEVLPRTLRGEALPPYVLSASSIATLLHRLFVYEPQSNPHPWHNIPALFPILQSLLQMLVLAPALLLVRPGARGRADIALEWSALLSATLAISTMPASYHFTLLLFPVTVLCARLLPLQRMATIAVVLLYISIGYPEWNTTAVDGLRAALHVPRLYLVFFFTAVLYLALGVRSLWTRRLRVENLVWCTGIAIALCANIASGLKQQHDLYADYAYRIPERSDVLLAAYPIATHGAVASVSLVPTGYRVLPDQFTSLTVDGNVQKIDELAQSSNGTDTWIEQSGLTSRIVPLHNKNLHPIEGAQMPILASDGRHLAYLREISGRDRLFTRSLDSFDSAETAITPSSMNVDSGTFLEDGSLMVAAYSDNRPLQLFHVQAGASPQPMNLGEVRYPTASPDGRWLAYSRFQSGAWNLWLYDRTMGSTRRLTHAACNQIQASWESDSKTLLYASDCGRGLWFTAICRRRVIP